VCGEVFKMTSVVLNSAPHTRQYGPNKMCSHTTEPSTTMYVIILTDYFNNL